MTPALAVVGHPNKGKSSIVATLAENTRVQIGPIPGTTRRADHFTLTIDGVALYELIDTPGFQRADQVHRWLSERAGDASARPDLVQAFVQAHQQDERFADECALLTPVLEGAGILYVVDGSKPYGPEYELEMDILRWTGQPRMALINMIGDGDYRGAWRAGLGQYFSIVREFNAHKASFEQRIALLRGFGELEETWREPLQRAAEALERERTRQREQVSETIAGMLQTALGAKAVKRLRDNQRAEDVQETLVGELRRQIHVAERQAQKEVQRIYRHEGSILDNEQAELVSGNLFTRESWDLFGLSRTQLVVTGAASGAVAGGAVDALLGGTSLFLGAVLGGTLGSVTAWFGGPELAKVKVLGSELGGDTAIAGPIREPNFPWVLLGRACLHHALVSELNHAVRDQVLADFAGGEDFFDFLDTRERVHLERLFTRCRKGEPDVREPLTTAILATLNTYQETAGSE